MTESPPLPPFSGERFTCKKCGHGEASYEWVPGGLAILTKNALPEYIRRKCLRCGASRCEQPKDSADATGLPPEKTPVQEAE